jgi:2-C-methyl-D-erythritol 4-phosphate cytidylyltransferase/2-C-methyl-D-erythritol 2,4-cyclodiphosphate synthase
LNDRAGDLADAVVVAAGCSLRMGGLDKLDWPIAGRPLLAHSLEALAGSDAVRRIVLVTRAARVETLRLAPWLPAAVVAVVPGGASRAASVAAGVAAVRALPGADDRVVLVHDGARPVVPAGLIARVVDAAAAHGAAIPALPIAETVKRVVGDRVAATVDRSELMTAQTPQAARLGLLVRALADPVAGTGSWTDEAALLEACRIPVHVIPGDPTNLKVTVVADLARATHALDAVPGSSRHGIGHDSHPFGPGGPLHLGGLTFDGVPRLAGHSDGDVALHAIADALLGAGGLGDLGGMFPADPSTPAGVASAELLHSVVARLREAGWRPAAVDVTLIGARPRLAPRLPAMRDAVAALLELEAARVNVKASSGNLHGSDGAGRTISALALASIKPLGAPP